MTIVQWEPARLLSSLFDTPSSGTVVGYPGAAIRRWVPPMDLVEAADHYLVRVDLPGMAEADVAIEVEDRTLTISGERAATVGSDESRAVRVERAGGPFRRTLTLPDGVDHDAIDASFEHGVLHISIPKPQERKPRRIQISSGRS